MKPGHILAGCVRPDIFRFDLIERQRRGIDETRIWSAPGQHFGRNDRAGIEADRAFGEQVAATHGDEVGGARAGADEVDRHGLVQTHWVIGMAGRHPVIVPTGSARDRAMRVSEPPILA
jgi:hypothetical protein